MSCNFICIVQKGSGIAYHAILSNRSADKQDKQVRPPLMGKSLFDKTLAENTHQVIFCGKLGSPQEEVYS